MLSPAVYDAMARESALNRDVAAIRTSLREIAEGKYQEVGPAFDGIRKKLLAMKAAKRKSR